jgi:hypothetical protein
MSQLVAYFFGGVFLANFVPHFVSGVLGREFPTPFASPPFRGPSPAPVNVLYGMLNLALAYVLLVRIGEFSLRSLDALAFGLGLTTWALMVARSVTKINRRNAVTSAARSDLKGT